MATDMDAGVMERMTAEFVMFEHRAGGFLFGSRSARLNGKEH
jgi:hypothetical protein